MNETLALYLGFLWEQFQYDWSWLSTPWVFYTFFPAVAYLIFFCIKWTVLLAPITIPCMILRWPVMQRPIYVLVRDDRGDKDPMPKIYNN